MTHQKQILKVVDRSPRKRKIPKYTRFVFGVTFLPGILGLIVATILKDLTLQDLLPFLGATFFLSGIIALTSTSLNDKKVVFDTESIVLFEDHIVFKSKHSISTIEISITQGLRIAIEYFGFDKGPQHWLFYSKHKTGNRNYITIQSKDGVILKKEFHLASESEIKRLRNNLDYYRIKGVDTSLLNKNHNH